MIFSELYCAYYNAIAKIISKIIDIPLGERQIKDIISDEAFKESSISILCAIRTQRWQIIRPDFTTPIENKPSMPLTDLQRRWLKAISLDPRIRLFDASFDFLEGVEPLFTPEDYRIYDSYSDGDPYEDEGYINRFKTILDAVRERAPLSLSLINRHGKRVCIKCMPEGIEYSEKDDKFRLKISGSRYVNVVNLGKVISCERYTGAFKSKEPRHIFAKKEMSVKIINERNALERCMLHFAHFEKRTERLETNHYLVHIKYDSADEAELVIRILSFGPLIEVVEPQQMRNLIIEKLKKQKNCGLK